MASSIKGTTSENFSNTIADVAIAVTNAERYGLIVEVMTTSLLYLKENPNATIETALNVGLGDWDV